MTLGRYFTVSEFERSQTAARRGIRNRMGPHQRASAEALCVHVLDPLRRVVGPVTVSSGYRSPALNRAIGGSSTSQHCHGEAADISANALSTRELFDLISLLGLPVDQMIEEFGRWVHVSHGPRDRRQRLKARRVGGRTRYTGVSAPVYTAKMRDLVRGFQRRQGLVSDGVIGPLTRAALAR